MAVIPTFRFDAYFYCAMYPRTFRGGNRGGNEMHLGEEICLVMGVVLARSDRGGNSGY